MSLLRRCLLLTGARARCSTQRRTVSVYDGTQARVQIMRTIDEIAKNVRANAAPGMAEEIEAAIGFVYQQLAAHPDSYFAAMLSAKCPEGAESPAHAVWVYMIGRAIIQRHGLTADQFDGITEEAFKAAARTAKLRRLS